MDGSKSVACVKATLGGGESRANDAFLRPHSGVPADLCTRQNDGNLLLRRFSELVDKYWNGSKSLLNNQQFRSQCHFLFVFVLNLDVTIFSVQTLQHYFNCYCHHN